MSRLFKNPFKYTYLRVMRHSGSPESIGRGVAIGFFTAFFIPFSLQMLAALALAIPLKAARLVALLCTWVSNPLTIAFLYPLQCYVGSHIIRHPLSFSVVRRQLSGIVHEPSFSGLFALGSDLLLSFLVGGLVFGIFTAIAGYFSVIPMIKHYRVKRMLKAKERAIRRMKHETLA